MCLLGRGGLNNNKVKEQTKEIKQHWLGLKIVNKETLFFQGALTSDDRAENASKKTIVDIAKERKIRQLL